MIGKILQLTETEWSDDRSTLVCNYVLETDEKTFELSESLKFPISIPESYETEKLTRALHIALSISYYKTFLPPEIEHDYEMTETEAGFWNGVFENGLGEFLFKNQLPFDRLARFSAQNGDTTSAQPTNDWQEKTLLGIGGGKDSIVAGELLKAISMSTTGFVLATKQNSGQATDVAITMDVDLQTIERTIDPQIIEINKLPGALNGHIPISLIFALCGAMLAAAQGITYVTVGNESSASIPRADWQGRAINHQWSKSLEFEHLLQDYLHAYVSKSLTYFSAIRPLSSVAVAKLFSKYEQYFTVFTSDNSVLKLNHDANSSQLWSKESTKSLSSYILLAPRISKATMHAIFGHDFLNDNSLEQTFRKLLGGDEEVILDCVGTPEELRASVYALKDSEYKDDYLVKLAQAEALLPEQVSLDTFYEIGDHALPSAIASSLTKEMKATLDV